MSRRIHVRVSPFGEITVEAEGFQGKGCEAATKAIEEALGVRDDPYVAGYRIWKYDLPWPAKNSDRTGYLFMGAPNERSTAQPPPCALRT